MGGIGRYIWVGNLTCPRVDGYVCTVCTVNVDTFALYIYLRCLSFLNIPEKFVPLKSYSKEPVVPNTQIVIHVNMPIFIYP